VLAVLREDRVDPQEVLVEAGFDPALLDDPDNLISYRDATRLLMHCESRTGCDYIGARIGHRAGLAAMGRPGRLARCQASARQGIRALVDHFNLYNLAATISLIRDGTYTRFVYAICEQGLQDTRHLQMGALAIMVNILQDLCGKDFAPAELRFACRPPRKVGPLTRFFHAPMSFDFPVSEVVFEDRWLDAALPAVDAGFRRQVESETESQRAAALENFPATVRSVLRKQLLLGRGSMDEVAGILGMHRRTLTRRLDEHEVGFRSLLESVHRDTACRLLLDTALHVQQIAESLHFSSAANFATAFRRWTGVTPSAYRAAILRMGSGRNAGGD
jgi:AraC-like DNA-binding protein